MQRESPQSTQDYYFKLAEVVQIYSNVDSILEKIHRDNCLGSVTSDFQQILENEIQYTVTGELNRTQETQKREHQPGLSGPVLPQFATVQRKPETDNQQSELLKKSI